MKEVLREFIEELYEGITEFLKEFPLTVMIWCEGFFTILCELVILVTTPLWIIPYSLYCENKDEGEGEEE